MPLQRIRLDQNGRIVQASERALALLELEPEAALGRYCWEVVRGTDDFGRPVCARCPVLARLRGGAYEAEVRLRVRGQRLRCQAIVQDSGVQVVLDERRRPKLGEVLFSLSWATQRMVDEPMRFFQTAELFLGKLRRAAGMDAAELFLADPEHKYLILTALDAENRSAFLERPWFALGEGYPGIVAVDRSPLVTHRLDEDERYLRLKVKEAGYRTYLVFPLELPQGVIGVLNLASKDANADESAALELLEAVAPVVAAGVYSVLTSMGERQLLALLRQSRLSDRAGDAVIESLLRSAMAFSGAKAAQYKDRSGHRVAVPAQLVVNCDREDCPVWIGEPYAVRAGGRPCPWVEEGRPRYCLPVVVQGEVVAVESIFFSRVPRPQTRAMAPLLWLQRMAWQLLAPRTATAEDPPPAPRLEVRALGALSVRIQGEALPPQRFQTLPWRLFKLFLAHPERVQTPEEIAEALWPDLDPAYAARRVARVVHELRKQIEPDAGSPRMLRSVEGGYLFRFTEGYAYDVERFEALIREADDQDDEGRALAGYLAALDLFRGEFLADEPYADWVEAERAYLRALAVRAGERAGELLEAMGQEKASLSLYRRLIAIDPSDPYLYDRLAAVLRSMGFEARAREIELRKQALLAGE